MKNKVLIVILFLPLLASLSLSQTNPKTTGLVLLKGKITDLLDSKPESVEIRFEDEKGKFFKIISNSLTGNFEQILESDKVYKVRLNSKTIFPTEFTVTTNKTEKYTEQVQNFSVLRLEVGRIVGGFDFFEDNSSNLQNNIRVLFDELNVKMKFNRSISLYFEVTANDSRSNFYEIKPLKGKKKAFDTMFIQKNYDDLVSKRFSNLENEIKKLSTAPERIEIRISKNNADEKKTFSISEKGCDVILRVKEIVEKIK